MQQHFRPILALGAAGARVDRNDRTAGVVFAGEQHAGFELLEMLRVGL